MFSFKSPRMSVIECQSSSRFLEEGFHLSDDRVRHTVTLKLRVGDEMSLTVHEAANIHAALHHVFVKALKNVLGDAPFSDSYPPDTPLMQALSLVFNRFDRHLQLLEQEKPKFPAARSAEGNLNCAAKKGGTFAPG